MIKTSTQLKALVRNQSKGNSTKAQIIIRNYIIERFLERVSLSVYRNNIILKGGILIASIIGASKRSTLDIDSTLKNIELSKESIRTIVQEIINIDINDNVIFSIQDISTIMEELDYPGMRVSLVAEIDKMKTPLKLDFSTGDFITPREIEYQYSLMFENRSISVLAYNLETILAEKFETIVSRATANSRMRDFYDVYMLISINESFNTKHFSSALRNTSLKRGTNMIMKDWLMIVNVIKEDEGMQKLWSSYQNKYDYASNVTWEDVIYAVKTLGDSIL